jgi:hypothetical protein
VEIGFVLGVFLKGKRKGLTNHPLRRADFLASIARLLLGRAECGLSLRLFSCRMIVRMGDPRGGKDG